MPMPDNLYIKSVSLLISFCLYRPLSASTFPHFNFPSGVIHTGHLVAVIIYAKATTDESVIHPYKKIESYSLM